MRSDTSRSDYTAARRAVGNQVLLRKVEFYGGQVASCKGDQKKLCCLMNNLMGRDSPTSLPSSESDIQLALDFSRFFQSKVLVRLFSVCAVVPIFITLLGVYPNFKTRTTAFYTF